MKKILQQVVACLCAVTLLLSACKKDNEVPTVNYTVKVTYPVTYTKSAAAGVKVTLTNSVTNTSTSAVTNEEGVATLNGLLPGNYQVMASRDLTAEEALPLTGYSVAVYLNASALNHVIQANSNASLDLVLNGSKVGGLVFKEVFYAGTKTPGGTNYLIDQFYEIYNNSTEVMYADSLCLADIQGNPAISSSVKPTGFQSDVNNAYARNVWMIPGNGKTYPIEPGKSIIIAQTAINHKTDPAGNPNSVDLGKGISDFEVYVASSTRDVDNPDVPNMIAIYTPTPGFYWQTYVFGPSMIIFKHPNPASLPQVMEPGTTATALYVQVPNANIIDGVDFLANATAGDKKRLPVAVDAGFLYASGTYNGESMVRKSKGNGTNGRLIYQDTNNTTDDFKVVAQPTPKK
jgi:hypothetical protein